MLINSSTGGKIKRDCRKHIKTTSGGCFYEKLQRPHISSHYDAVSAAAKGERRCTYERCNARNADDASIQDSNVDCVDYHTCSPCNTHANKNTAHATMAKS